VDLPEDFSWYSLSLELIRKLGFGLGLRAYSKTGGEGSIGVFLVVQKNNENALIIGYKEKN
jgi:hypothetical protein